MKKFVTTITIVLVFAALCAGLVACNKNYEGTYVFEDIEISGSEEAQELLDGLKGFFKDMQFKLEKDGKVSTSNDGGQTWEEDGTYKVENNNLKMYDKDGKETTANDATYKFEGKKLIMSYTDDDATAKITFKKK